MRVLSPLFGLFIGAVAAGATLSCIQAAHAQSATPAEPAARRTARLSGAEGAGIAAVVNGDVISAGDVFSRARLFALSTGLPMSQDVLDRLVPQVRRQLIDERQIGRAHV